jgi:hypothetical protein
MAPCVQCGGNVEERYRYCPWCAAPLRRKLVEFFPGRASDERDAVKALRVSRYLDERHVRFSVWDESGVAEAAVSVDERTAARLAHFLRPAPPRPRTTFDALRETLSPRR